MQYIRDVKNLQLHQTAIALGKFDGFHRGHQLLLEQVSQWQRQGFTGVIFTFSTAGASIGSGKHIDSSAEKRKKAEVIGIDVFLEYPFTKEFASLEPETFVQEILLKQLDVKAVAIGRDFRFGKNRKGDAELLEKLEQDYGFQVRVFDKLKEGETEISSSVIREAIENGNMELVTTYMGQGYSVCGEVVHGKRLGHTINIPTVNLRVPEDKILPPFGVYGGKITWNGKVYYGIANLGYKPTVSEEKIVGLETYIFDFQQDIYGEEIEVELLHFIRPEQKFSGLEELTAQMNKDIEAAKLYFLQLP